MPVPKAPTIICPACPAQERNVLPVAVEASSVRCPVCRSRFRLITRQVRSSHSRKLDARRTLYELVTREGADRVRLRRLVAPASVTFAPHSWVTLVYDGEALRGVAEQTASVWYPVPAFTVKSGVLRHLLAFLGALCLLLAALQLDRLVPALESVARRPQGALSLVVLAVFLLAPALLWALQTGWGAQPRRYLPAGDRQL